MRNVLLIVCFFTFYNCKAQDIIAPIFTVPNPPAGFTGGDGVYKKDLDNDLDKFVGVWKWENTNSSLTIHFTKIVKYHDQYPNFDGSKMINEWHDYLVGEYSYSENGVMLSNSLPLVLDKDPYKYAITSGQITTTNYGKNPECNECPQDARFVRSYFSEKENPKLVGRIIMVHYIQNGIEKIKAHIYQTGISNLTAAYIGSRKFKVPRAVYTFVKQ